MSGYTRLSDSFSSLVVIFSVLLFMVLNEASAAAPADTAEKGMACEFIDNVTQEIVDEFSLQSKKNYDLPMRKIKKYAPKNSKISVLRSGSSFRTQHNIAGIVLRNETDDLAKENFTEIKFTLECQKAKQLPLVRASLGEKKEAS